MFIKNMCVTEEYIQKSAVDRGQRNAKLRDWWQAAKNLWGGDNTGQWNTDKTPATETKR